MRDKKEKLKEKVKTYVVLGLMFYGLYWLYTSMSKDLEPEKFMSK
jgi:hypothetical protein|tara:strand:- start:805 stop:939 length:135 start_codon:yes stop_codon:yes gene_type:complete